MTPGANDLCVFAVKRGFINNKRQDAIGTYNRLINTQEYCYPTKKLGKIVTSYSGGTPSKSNDDYWKGDIPWVSPKDFVHFYLHDSEDHICENAIASSATKLTPINSVLVVVRSGILKHTLPIAINTVPVTINQDVKVLLPDNSLLPQYLGYYLKTFEKKVLEICVKHSTTVQSVNTNEFFSLDIPVPPVSIQKRLTTYLDTAAGRFEEQLQQANVLLAGMDNYVLSTLGITMPEYSQRLVCAVTLANICTDNTMDAGYYHPERMATIHMMQQSHTSTVQKLNNIVDFHRDIVSSANSTQLYLGLAGVQADTGELSGVDEEAAGQAFTYEKGDVLYGRLRPYLNKVLLAENEGICSPEFHVMRVKEGVDLLPAYLAAIMRSSLILSQTRHMMTGNTHPRISNDDVKSLYIPVPDINTQKKIAEEVIKRRQKARLIKQEAELDWSNAKAQFEKELLEE